MKSKYSRPEESPGYLLWRISTQWRRNLERALKSHGLTHPQFVVLASTAWLSREGNMITQADVGKQAGLDPNTTSQILKTLEKKKLIARKPLLNARSLTPQLTSIGITICQKAVDTVETEDAKFFDSLTKEELEMLKKLNRSMC